jgi:creatinine amidohydrolase
LVLEELTSGAVTGDLLPRSRAEGVRAVSPNGVLGDPAGASAGEGRAPLDAAIADLRAFVGRIPTVSVGKSPLEARR